MSAGDRIRSDILVVGASCCVFGAGTSAQRVCNGHHYHIPLCARKVSETSVIALTFLAS